MIRVHVTLLGALLLGACTSEPAARTIAANDPALAGPAAPEIVAASPLDTTVTYLPDGTRRAEGSTRPQSVTPGAAAAAGYTCPMHEEVHAAEPGECPICGMDLVPVQGGGAR